MLLKFSEEGRELGGEDNIGGKWGLEKIMTIRLYSSNTISWVKRNYFEVEKLVTVLKNEDFCSFLRFIHYIIKYKKYLWT